MIVALRVMGTSYTPVPDLEPGPEPNIQPTWGSGWMIHAQHHHRLHLWTIGPTRPHKGHFGHFFYFQQCKARPNLWDLLM